MRNYNTLEDKIKEEMANYISKLIKEFGKVDGKFISDIVSGILTKNSIILSDIVRAKYGQEANIKKGVERLERHLDDFPDIKELLENNYKELVKPYINDRHLYFVDDSDIVKDQNTRFENLGDVLDGSNEHQKAHGYKLYEIATLDNSNQPIGLISQLKSSKEKTLDTNPTIWFNNMMKVANDYGKGTFICDRGYDGAILMNKIIESGNDFIIRGNKTRKYVYINGEKKEIKEICKKHKGKYSMTITYKDNQKQSLKVSYFNVRLHSNDANTLKDKPLTMIMVKGFHTDSKTLDSAYIILFTSRIVSGKNDAIQVVRDYTSRWKIEEFFKFKKQQYGLEKIKVRRYERIKALNQLLEYSIFFNNVMNLTMYGKEVRRKVAQVRKNITFWLYRISDGIATISSFLTTKIYDILYPKRYKRRRDLFTVMGVRFNPFGNEAF